MRAIVAPALALVLGLTAMLAPSGPALAEPQARIHAAYQVYAMGLHVADVDAMLSIGPVGYRMDITYATTGVLGFFSTGRQVSSVEGGWSATAPLPHQYRSTGAWRGEDRIALIDYESGHPIVRRIVPPREKEYEPVPEAIRDASTDTLSAAAELLRRAARTGRCEARGLVYEGRRASELTARTGGEEIVPPTTRSVFAGRALRCDFTGHVVAGFKFTDDASARTRPLSGSAWLAQPVPGAIPIPVQLWFETRWFGTARMYLTSARADPPVVVASEPAPVSPPPAAATRSRPSR